MKRVLSLAAGLLLLFNAATQAAEYATKEEAKQLIEKAIAHLDAVGRDKAFADFHEPNGPFLYRDLYLVVFDFDGLTLVQGMSPKLVGKNRLDQTDSNGKPYIKEAIEIAKKNGEGWIEYLRTNPQTKTIEEKISYVKRHGDFVFMCGVYKPR